MAAYRDPKHPGNRLRPRVRCAGCGKFGCVTRWGPCCFGCNVTRWGPWCFDCNVPRVDRISRALEVEMNLRTTRLAEALQEDIDRLLS